MQFDKKTGLWKENLEKALELDRELDEESIKTYLETHETILDKETKIPEPGPKLNGKCVLTIRFEDREQYEEWKRYNPVGRQWEFLVSFPACMQAEYIFRNALDVEVMTKKIIQLLQMGFDVHATRWTLDEQ